MRLLRFVPRSDAAARGASPPGTPRVGVFAGEGVIEPAPLWDRQHDVPFPDNLVGVVANEEARLFCHRLADGSGLSEKATVHRQDDVRILAPIAQPPSFRDFYSFEEHVRRARARRGLEVPAAWYLRPTFYFSNPYALFGPGDEIRRPASTRELDFEVEIGCVLGRVTRDATLEEAGASIAGYVLLNDWSARDVQREEMAVGLGPSKGKDFATSLGPFLVTPDELEPLRAGKGYDVRLEVSRNGRALGAGNWASIYFSFEEMIAHASRDVTLYPGDLLGSGTVGGGCILEIGPEEAGGWLEPGDRVEISGGVLGVLRNHVAAP